MKSVSLSIVAGDEAVKARTMKRSARSEAPPALTWEKVPSGATQAWVDNLTSVQLWADQNSTTDFVWQVRLDDRDDPDLEGFEPTLVRAQRAAERALLRAIDRRHALFTRHARRALGLPRKP